MFPGQVGFDDAQTGGGSLLNGGIADINRLPHAIFIVDIGREHLALAEAKKLGIKTFAMVDTNADPNLVDFPIPANDDSSRSISFITNYITNAIKEGLAELFENPRVSHAGVHGDSIHSNHARRGCA